MTVASSIALLIKATLTIVDTNGIGNKANNKEAVSILENKIEKIGSSKLKFLILYTL